ncbi:MAG: Lactaldehyde dehydrogenase [Candidatus Amesbacteria bacterium GW2011_GWA1_47_20]|uniref:Lactaldehyde dehydrogenase n=1 Tax=Candidatus Amesbacteria bacterium GW2011_GWA1_47_20 TaxID=1618354 RepID=A0A0G1VDH2_9BACT|nr:MAG: Lactaldehyde dehydrogenase [Candidatus Amesbacteria bacterium GW2011_GWA1_47_20]
MCADLLMESGFPDGVFNLIIGSKDVGRMLIDAPIDLVWFTGSTKAGLEIYKKCGEKFVKAICEMGGSSAGIVFVDADLEVTMENLYWARFLNCGQVCSAVKRLFIEKPVYDQVLQKFVDRLKQVKIGNPLEEVDFGPLVFPKQVTKLEEVVAEKRSLVRFSQ